jgi:hypothetical protein
MSLRLRRLRPAGFIEPCLPVVAIKPPTTKTAILRWASEGRVQFRYNNCDNPDIIGAAIRGC